MKIVVLNYKRTILISFLLAGLALVPVFVFSQADETVETLPGIPQEKITAALADLSNLLHFEVKTVSEARSVCDQEQYLQPCIDVGKKYSLYSAEEVKTVDAVVSQIKGKIVEDLQNCKTEECLVKVANDLAKKLVTKNSELATQLDLTSKKIEEKRVIVNVAKEIGVSFKECRDMDPDTASIDLLKSCARLAKDTRVSQHIPEDKRGVASTHVDKTIELRESLAKKELNCGDGTLESCGKFCLNPTSEAVKQGVSSIPLVCRQIAERFFGGDGVRQLEDAYRAVSDVAVQQNKKVENVAFTTPEGKVLANPEEIGRYLEEEGKKGNVEAVEKGMNFMVERGFVKSEERDFVLQFIRKIKEGNKPIDFDACDKDPESCREFIPDNHKEEFEIKDQIHLISAEEIGFDPRECDRGKFDSTVADRCFEGTKRALPKLETLASKSEEGFRIVSDLKRMIAEQEERRTSRERTKENFKVGGSGPGGCKSEQECRVYCSDPTHGPECIAFGAKSGIFKGQEAVRRYEQYNDHIYDSEVAAPLPTTAEEAKNKSTYRYDYKFRGRGPYEGFVPPGQGGIPPGQFPGFREPGRGFGPVGPSPECFAAIQAGDFARAKELCEVRKDIIKDTSRSYYPPICPAIAPSPDACREKPGTIPVQGQNCEIVCIQTYVPPPVPPDGLPRIDKMYPNSGPIGSRVTIYGFGFDPNENRINFDVGVILGVGSSDGGRSITFVVPEDRAPLCAFTEPRCLLPAPYNPVKPGTYEVSVTTSKGTSNRFSFSVIAPISVGDNECRDLLDLLPGCHYMGESPKARFDSSMTKYVLLDGSKTVRYCDKERIAGCVSGSYESCPVGSYKYYPPEGGAGYCKPTGGTTSKEQIWNSLGLRSWIHENADLARIESLKKVCANVAAGANVWLPGAGDNYSADFGMPDPVKCERAAQCTTSQYFDGTSCSGSNLSCSTPSNCYDLTKCESSGWYWYDSACWSYPKSNASTTTTTCSSEAIRLLGSGCHTMYSAWFNSEMTKWINPGTTAVNDCTTKYAYGCTVGNGNQASTTISVDCSSKYGTGWHSMDSTGSCFNSAMTEYKTSGGVSYQCSTNYVSGCSSTTTTTCPTGQYWSGTACVNSNNASTTTHVDCSTKYGTGWHVMDSTGRCFDPDMKNYRDPGGVLYSCSANFVSGCSGAVTTCPTGQYWSGTACVNNVVTTTTTTTTTCPTGQYWSGTSCVNSTTATTTTSYPNITSNTCSTKYGTGWHIMDDGSSNRCFSSDMTKWREYEGTEYLCSSKWINGCSGSSTTTTTTTTTSCGTGYYWNGTSCVISTTTSSTTSTSCGTGYYWNGSSCVVSTTGSTSCSGKYGDGWHIMDDGSSGRCFNTSMTEYRNSDGTLYQCSTNHISGCGTSSGTTTTTTCPSGQYWSGTACVTSTTTTTVSECETKYGTGWHLMSTPGVCFSSDMTQYRDTGGALYSCSTNYTSGCSGTTTTTTTCPSGQYWSGTACVSTCPTSQYWNGSACVNTTSSTANTLGNKLFATLKYSLESLGEVILGIFDW